MAQTTGSPSKGSSTRKGSSKSRNGSRATGSNNSAASKRSSSKSNSKRSSSNGNRAKTTSAARSRSKSRSTAQSRNGAASIKDTAIDRTKAARHVVAEAASKAKTPLIAGGTALVGAAAGAVVKDRLATNRSSNPLKRLRGVSMPKPAAKLNLGKLDLETVKSAAERVSSYGQQASDIAAALEKTRKKNK